MKGCETPSSESERLLQHSYHILKLRQSDGTVEEEKNLIGSVKINKVTPSQSSTVVCSLIMFCTETSIVRMKQAALSPALTHTAIIISPNIKNEEELIQGQRLTNSWWYLGPCYDGLSWQQISVFSVSRFPPIITKSHVTAQNSSIPCICLLIHASLWGFLLEELSITQPCQKHVTVCECVTRTKLWQPATVHRNWALVKIF